MAFQIDAFDRAAFQERPNASGQANALIDSPHKLAFGQAQTKIVVATTPYQKVVHTQIPFAYLKLNESSGTTYTNTWGSGDGTGDSNITQSVANPLNADNTNTGVTFNSGSLSRLSLTPAGMPTATGAAVTVTGWVKIPNSGLTQMIFGFTQYDILYNVGASRLGFNTGAGDTYGFNPSAILGNWVHIAAVYYNNQNYTIANKIYINGVSQSLASGSSTGAFASTFYLSGWGVNGSEWARGTSLDEVALFSRELTSTEIAAQYDAGFLRVPSGQAQAFILGFATKSGQAQAQILGRPTRSGQAQCYITQAPSFYNTTVAASSPSGHWPLTDASGTVAIAVVGSNGTYKSTGITYRINAAMASNNVNLGVSAAGATWMHTNTSDVTNTFAFEAWFRVSTTIVIPGAESIGGIYSNATSSGSGGGTSPNNLWFPEQRSGNRGIGVSVGTNGIVVEAHGDSTLCAPAIYSGTISSTWHHLVINVISKQSFIYLDGVLVRTGLTMTETVYRPISLLGNDSYGPYTGDANNAALYPTSLTLTQIQDNYNAGVPKGYGQAQAKIAASPAFGQAQALILGVHWGWGQAQAKLNAFNVNGSGQANADIRVFDNNRFAQAQVLIQTDEGILKLESGVWTTVSSPHYPILTSPPTLSLAAVFVADETGTWQFKTVVDDTVVLYIGNTLVISDNFSTTPLTGSISLTSGQVYTIHLDYVAVTGPNYLEVYYQRPSDAVWYSLTDNNPPWIRHHVNFGQGQAQARLIGVGIKSAQATADILATNNAFGQAQATILRNTQQGNAQADIKAVVRNYAQANADIKKTGRGSGQAFAHIIPPTFYGQAQARIIAFDVSRSGQAQARILTTYSATGNARVFIHKNQGYAQATVSIKSVRNRGFGQARVFIGHTQSGIAAAYILKSALYGQALASIRETIWASGQAQAQIVRHEGQGNAQAQIVGVIKCSAQAQAIINQALQAASAMASIVQTFTASGQARARIKTINPTPAQAQALIFIRYKSSGQAQASIANKRNNSGQAQVQIGSLTVAQAQARIVSFNVPRTGQAVGYILADPSVTPSGPTSRASTYLVKFGEYLLPGYAQSESYDSVETLFDHPTLAEYISLDNKIVEIKMKVWEPTYEECKAQVTKAATMVRSSRNDFEKLYVQVPDAYYLALTSKIRMEKAVQSSMRELDYSVIFETKPWLISNALYEISGTGSIETTGRTMYDGTWTPVRLIVSGTDVVITGITDSGLSTGRIEFSGTVSNVVVDTEAFTATSGGINMNDSIVNKDYSLYVGPGNTTFQIDGATSCVIQYNNRWVLFKGKGRTGSAQPLADTPIVD